MTETTLLARQPIYDARQNIQAFELLFRSGDDEGACIRDADAASSAVIVNAFTVLPLADVLEGKPAFINFTRALLDHELPIDPQNLVVEILEDVEVDASMIAAVSRLKRAGYRIALDDYVFAEHHAELLALADIIKIDVLNQSWDSVLRLTGRLRLLRKTLLAEKVETAEMFDACQRLGFSLFQGYFLARPQVLKGRKLSSNQQTALQLIAALRKPDINMREIETLIQTDAVLSLKLLRMANSAMFNLKREIDSIQRAATLLGMERIRSLAQLLILSGFENKPRPLLASTLLRARLGQTMAEHLQDHAISPDSLFTAGLLSTLDAYLDMDLATILHDLPIGPALKQTLLERSGAGGLLLDTAIAFDEAALDRIDWPQLAALGLPPTITRDLYLQSLSWVQNMMRSLR